MLHWLDATPARRVRALPERDGSNRPSSRLVAFGVAVAVALLGTAWLASHRTVTLVIDGASETVGTHADTVGDLLRRAGVDVSPDDRVEPGLDEEIVHDMRVEVVHAREITLLIGDDERVVVVAALTVDDALQQLAHLKEAPAGRRTLVRPSRLSRVSNGMVVELSDPVGLTVLFDDVQRDLITDEPTVADVLARLGIELGPHDRITPEPERATEHGMVVQVERVEIREEVREEALPFGTEERRTGDLQRGERREVQAGTEGVRRIVEEITVVDGVEEAREQVQAETLRAPETRIVEVGTAPPARRAPENPPPGPEVAAAEPAEPDEPANVEEGKASWYDNPYGGYTAAHRSLPRGTTVTVTNVANGRSVEVRINDRGPFVDGRVIDLNREAFAEIASPSKGVVHVRVEW